MGKDVRAKRDYSSAAFLSKIKNEFEQKTFKKDERFWVLSRDKNNAGTAIIRFLPNLDGNELPFLPNFKHSFDLGKTKKTFVEKCPTSIGKTCPICEWNSEQDKDWVKDNYTYRRKSWICNILVLSDPANPENNGKVFLFEFGKQVYDKLKEALHPDTDEELLLFFDEINGANFKVKVVKEGQFPTWVNSKFLSNSSLEDELEKAKIEESVEEILEKCFNIKEIIEGNTYKTFDEIKSKFENYLKGINKTASADDSENDNSYKNKKAEAKKSEDEETPAPKKAKPAPKDEEDEPVAPKKSKPAPKEEEDEDVKPAPVAKPKADKTDAVKKVKDYFAQYDDSEDEK